MKKFLLILSFLGVIVPQVALAQPTGTATTTNQPTYDGQGQALPKIDSPVKATSIEQLIVQVIQYLLSIIALAAIVMVIWAGVRLIFNSGNERKRAESKTMITWAIIGLVLALLSFSIVRIVQALLQP
ncbi:MAG: pilin [Candidatus Doudnabacteria bacterium]